MEISCRAANNNNEYPKVAKQRDNQVVEGAILLRNYQLYFYFLLSICAYCLHN